MAMKANMEQYRAYVPERAEKGIEWTLEKVIRPSRDVYLNACENYPIATLFGSVWLFCSIIPIGMFLGFALSFIAALVIAAMVIISFSTFVFVGGAGVILLGVLGFALFTACVITGIILFNFALWKLATHVLDVGLVQGTKNFAQDTKTHFCVESEKPPAVYNQQNLSDKLNHSQDVKTESSSNSKLE